LMTQQAQMDMQKKLAEDNPQPQVDPAAAWQPGQEVTQPNMPWEGWGQPTMPIAWPDWTWWEPTIVEEPSAPVESDLLRDALTY
jgi:hypothetical protein